MSTRGTCVVLPAPGSACSTRFGERRSPSSSAGTMVSMGKGSVTADARLSGRGRIDVAPELRRVLRSTGPLGPEWNQHGSSRENVEARGRVWNVRARAAPADAHRGVSRRVAAMVLAYDEMSSGGCEAL